MSSLRKQAMLTHSLFLLSPRLIEQNSINLAKLKLRWKKQNTYVKRMIDEGIFFCIIEIVDLLIVLF